MQAQFEKGVNVMKSCILGIVDWHHL